MNVEGWIEMLHCAECDASQPHWIFSADTDMATAGLTSAGDRHGSLLVLSKASVVEACPELKAAKFLRAEVEDCDAAGLSFAEFREHRVPPALVFACPWCDRGEMTSGRRLTSQEFVSKGGRLDCRDGIVIRE